MHNDRTARAETLKVVLRQALGQVFRVSEDKPFADLLSRFDQPLQPLPPANRPAAEDFKDSFGRRLRPMPLCPLKP